MVNFMYVYFTTIKKDTQNDANYFTRINTHLRTHLNECL